nr:MAG TPA: hypothetical protein [Caudoviricetes sp.]
MTRSLSCTILKRAWSSSSRLSPECCPAASNGNPQTKSLSSTAILIVGNGAVI